MARNSISDEIINDLNDIADTINKRIQAYADLHGISFEEARRRAKLTIDGKTQQIDEEPDEQD